ncbi:MAG: hypothetical protein ACTSQ7_11830 [Alphaproteobacteria bacterium]
MVAVIDPVEEEVDLIEAAMTVSEHQTDAGTAAIGECLRSSADWPF